MKFMRLFLAIPNLLSFASTLPTRIVAILPFADFHDLNIEGPPLAEGSADEDLQSRH
jgi:hypothetical protein